MVIAILAAVTIVSFNGIQQSSKNTAIIDAASKSLRMIQAHVSSKNTYPYAVDSTFVCITTESTCRRNSPDVPGVAAFDTAMQATGSLPRSVPLASDTRAGITYHYVAARTVDGQSAPAILSYYLLGTNTPCIEGCYLLQ